MVNCFWEQPPKRVFLWFLSYCLAFLLFTQQFISQTYLLQIEPQLLSGKNVMIAAHGNSLRSIIMYLDKLTSEEVRLYSYHGINPLYRFLVCFWPTEFILVIFCCYQVISLELSTGIPMLYISQEGKFIRRGSPSGPTEAGVYAYTKVWNFSPGCLLSCSDCGSLHVGIYFL